MTRWSKLVFWNCNNLDYILVTSLFNPVTTQWQPQPEQPFLVKFIHMLQAGSLSCHIIIPRACARGKVIGLSVCCYRCWHQNGLTWTFRHFSELYWRLNYRKRQKQARLGQESNDSGHKSHNHCFCVCHAYQPHPQLTITLPLFQCILTLSLEGQLAHGVCALETSCL